MSIRDHVARHSDFDETKDFIPTPGYATRALFEYVLKPLWRENWNTEAYTSVWDPAAGKGHMSEVFKEYNFSRVMSSDAYDWGPHRISGYDEIEKFQHLAKTGHKSGLVITNPPYAEIQDFVDWGLQASNVGLALLTRIQFLEGQRRYRSVFSQRPPTQVAIFSDRIPFKTNITVRKAPKMFTHCWVVWLHGVAPQPLTWIPPDAQMQLEKMSDYDEYDNDT